MSVKKEHFCKEKSKDVIWTKTKIQGIPKYEFICSDRHCTLSKSDRCEARKFGIMDA